MPAVANLVHQTSEGTGTGALALTLVNGKQTFAQAFPGGTGSNSFDYFISNRQFPEWERGTGHWDDSTLVRDTVLESSNSDALVSFSAGIKDITNDVPALKQVQTDLAQTLTNKEIIAPTGIVKADVGLGDVDNTSDADKPVSTATQAALDLKADSADLATVATTGDYDDLLNKPTLGVLAAGDGAGDVPFTPAGNIAATDVQAAIAELDTEKQPLDSDLTAIAGLSPSNDDIVQRKAGAWTNRSMAQLATDLNLAATYQPLDSDLTSWAGVTRASGFDTFVATPSSANLRSLLTDETGTGAAVFADSPTFTTQTTNPKVIGGTGTGDSLTLQSTSGAGATDQISLKVGNNGATEAARIDTNGKVLVNPQASTTVPARITIYDPGTNQFQAISTATPSGSSGAGMAGHLSSLPTAADHRLGFFLFGTNNLSGTIINSVGLLAFSGQSWTAGSAQGSYFDIVTTPNGSATRATGFRLGPSGQPYFPLATTTASAANAVLDNATTPANELKRSTSSLAYKRNVEPLDQKYANAILGLQPIWYRSNISTDNQDWSWYGLGAEDVAKVEPRLVNWGYKPEDFDFKVVEDDGGLREVRTLKKGAQLSPDGVAYDRLSVMLLAIIKEQEARIAALEARVG